MSRPSDPVDITWTSCTAAESIFMMEPLPNCFSICARAACSALALASSMTFPSLTILIISYIGALEAGARRRHLSPAVAQRPNAAVRKPVDLDFYTGFWKMQALVPNQDLGPRASGAAERD